MHRFKIVISSSLLLLLTGALWAAGSIETPKLRITEINSEDGFIAGKVENLSKRDLSRYTVAIYIQTRRTFRIHPFISSRSKIDSNGKWKIKFIKGKGEKKIAALLIRKRAHLPFKFRDPNVVEAKARTVITYQDRQTAKVALALRPTPTKRSKKFRVVQPALKPTPKKQVRKPRVAKPASKPVPSKRKIQAKRVVSKPTPTKRKTPSKVAKIKAKPIPVDQREKVEITEPVSKPTPTKKEIPSKVAKVEAKPTPVAQIEKVEVAAEPVSKPAPTKKKTPSKVEKVEAKPTPVAQIKKVEVVAEPVSKPTPATQAPKAKVEQGTKTTEPPKITVWVEKDGRTINGYVDHLSLETVRLYSVRVAAKSDTWYVQPFSNSRHRIDPKNFTFKTWTRGWSAIRADLVKRRGGRVVSTSTFNKGDPIPE